jgi:tetratricopeptide (TPR) repeat protein
MTLKRKLALTAAVSAPVLLLLVMLLLSSPMMDWYQKRIDREPQSDLHRSLQMLTADVCLATWRPEMAAARYRFYYERYKADLQRAHALLCYAQALEDAGRNADAIDIYRKYLIEYPDHEEKAEAEIGMNRINNSRR